MAGTSIPGLCVSTFALLRSFGVIPMSHPFRRRPAGHARHHAGELPLLAVIFFFLGLAIGLHFA